MKNVPAVRPPAVAGMFYNGDAARLRRDVEGLLARVPPSKATGALRGLVAPHAGYMYSGFTAAHAYALLPGTVYDTVIVLSPSHREYFAGATVYPGDAYSSPLGNVPIDIDLRDRLLEHCGVLSASIAGHRTEHAVEVQLPFLQVALGQFALLPIVLGDQSRATCFAVGGALGGVVEGRRVLIVASTDLSHYHSGQEASVLDAVVVDDLNRFDEEQLMTDLETERTEACGGGPVVAAMSALRLSGARRMTVLHHSTSGDITGDTSSVVGYLAAAGYA